MRNCVVVRMNKIMFGPASESACLDFTRHTLCQDPDNRDHTFYVYRNHGTSQAQRLWRLWCGRDDGGKQHMYKATAV